MRLPACAAGARAHIHLGGKDVQRQTSATPPKQCAASAQHSVELPAGGTVDAAGMDGLLHPLHPGAVVALLLGQDR